VSGLVCVVDRRGSTLEFASGVLTIRSPEHSPWRVGVSQLSLLIVHGRVAVETTMCRGLADAGVGVALTGGRHGDDIAWLAAGLSTTGTLRHRQHLAYADQQRRLELARWVLEQKFSAMRREVELGWPAGCKRLRRAIARAEGTLETAADVASLIGIEGALAANWFASLAECLDRRWGFAGRNRRPPRDPLNALLSYGYALAGSDALAAVQRLGFDPAIAFLHELYPGRYALPLDALECVRPSIDAIAVQLLWSDLAPENFKDDAIKGCRLDKKARLSLIRGWHAAREQTSERALSGWCHALRLRLSSDQPSAEAESAGSVGQHD